MLIDDMKVKDRIVNHELFSETEPDSSIQEIGDRWWKEEAIDNVYAGITGDGEIVYPDGSLVPIKGVVQNVSDLDNINEYGYLVDAMLAKELKNDVNTLQNTVKELNSKIPHFYNGEIVLHYYGTTWLYAREFVGKEFAGCYPQITCLYREGQPNLQTTMISAVEVDSDGYLVIWAYGSGYVSGHMLGVSVSICK